MFGLTCYDYLGLLCGMQLIFCCGTSDVSTLVWTRCGRYIIEYEYKRLQGNINFK